MIGCPATGRMVHVFDKVTHRCRCGRWQNGYKPKKEPVKPRAECQICERKQALDNHGSLGHHGYKRPGWGCIEGDCMGVGHGPYPATDALELYLAAVRGHIKRCEDNLTELPNLESIEYSTDTFVGHKRVQRTYTVKRGGESFYDPEVRTVVPSFDDIVGRTRKKLLQEIDFAGRDEVRIVKRIAAAKEHKS